MSFQGDSLLDHIGVGVGVLMDTCELCGRENQSLSGHHLVPKARHNKKVKRDLGKNRNVLVMICMPCHRQLHSLFTNKELEREYNTLEKLKDHPDVIAWIEWVQQRPSWN